MLHKTHHKEMKHLNTLHYIDTVARIGSIRKAAESLAITSTALNRRILALEAELGVPVFERLPRGVRLSAAGEVLVSHIRNQISEMERVKSHIADLAGERRGHIAIACSQALLPYFLPEQISDYRARHPRVTFAVQVRDRAAAEKALLALDADIALVFEPVRLQDLEVLLTVRQPVCALMTADHPLAAQQTVRLRDCLAYPHALPTLPYGVRDLLELAVGRTSASLDPVIESDSFEFLRHQVKTEGIIGFQIAVGLSPNEAQTELVARELDPRDVPPGNLYVCQLKGRTLSVAAARFANQMLVELAERFEAS